MKSTISVSKNISNKLNAIAKLKKARDPITPVTRESIVSVLILKGLAVEQKLDNNAE